MKLPLLTTVLFSASVYATPNPSFSEVRIGFENIGYSETLNDVAGFGQLSQSIDVTNPAIRQISYTGIDDDWGFYVESAATISTDIATETWYMGEFGAIQENAFKIKANEIGFKGAYNFTQALQFTVGTKFFTSSFTRSNFSFVQPGAEKFDQALIAISDDPSSPARFTLPGMEGGQPGEQQNYNSQLRPVISVSEDQMGILLTLGARYDSRLKDSFNKYSWYIEGEVSSPMYSEIQNTQFETTTLTDSFNGWGVLGRIGMRYQVMQHIAIIAGIDAQYKSRDIVTENLENGQRLRVPEVEYSNVSFALGGQWSY
ncbi:autotransporter outer membrane beta-barrel domain-containing protein [Pseudoalteromonas sp. SaAl2]